MSQFDAELAELDSMLKTAFISMLDELRQPGWWRREHELVNLFVFGYLIPLCSPGRVLHDLTQIGMEAAVPQLPGRGGDRKNPDVCKDLVIWPEARMTCWGQDGSEMLKPLCVLEWTSLNRQGRASTRRDKEGKYQEDLDWLVQVSRSAERFVGYAVLVDQQTEPLMLRVNRARDGRSSEPWTDLVSSA